MNDFIWLLVLAVVVVLALWILHARIAKMEDTLRHEIREAEHRAGMKVLDIKHDVVNLFNKFRGDRGEK